MSEQNVELVREVIAAYERGAMEKVFAAYDTAIEWDIGAVQMTITDFEPVYRGHDGVRRFWHTWLAAWEVTSFEYEEFIEAGDTVVSILSQRMKGRASGIEQDWVSYAQNWTIRNGKIVRVKFFLDRASALAAAGVPASS